MNERQRLKKRGFVMTGGGAKGLYEAGVIHAFHITGMEFDVVTGSSIGAMNTIFFAEYLLRKRELSPEVRDDPERAIEAMDAMVKTYHHAWLQMPEERIIDDSEQGPLGRLKDDLLRFNLDLPQITRLIWWWTDPDRQAIPSPGVWPSLLKLGRELVERLGGVGELLRILKHHRSAPFQEAARTYLARFGMERSLVPPKDDGKLTSVFTEPVTPLRIEHLQGKGLKEVEDGGEKVALVRPGRTLRDYAQAGIDVRLTRANYRTGRLEISAYLSTEDFIRYMQKQAFRLEKADPEKMPLGSFRLQLPGNPNAINAALASGRFPGVLAPYPVEDIYPPDDPENALLRKILANWLDDPEVESQMSEAYQAVRADEAEKEGKWGETYNRWRESQSMREFFPRIKDVYVDGGAIDNTPSNSAIDAIREWAEGTGTSKRDIVLDLYVVFLHPEPTVGPLDIKDPALHQVVQRTLEIQGAAKQSSDAVVVDTINTFGKRGEKLGDTLLVLLESYQETLRPADEKQRRAILDRLLEKARERKLRGYLGSSGEGILERMEGWAENIIRDRLPLQVEAVKIYPEEMPLNTLQFTERLGYQQENAINMLTMGCYNTLWALRSHLEGQKKDLDAQDQGVLTLTRKWMGIEEWPKDYDERENLRQSWRCRRTECVFHAQHCPRGARPSGLAGE